MRTGPCQSGLGLCGKKTRAGQTNGLLQEIKHDPQSNHSHDPTQVI